MKMSPATFLLLLLLLRPDSLAGRAEREGRKFRFSVGRSLAPDEEEEEDSGHLCKKWGNIKKRKMEEQHQGFHIKSKEGNFCWAEDKQGRKEGEKDAISSSPPGE